VLLDAVKLLASDINIQFMSASNTKPRQDVSGTRDTRLARDGDTTENTAKWQLTGVRLKRRILPFVIPQLTHVCVCYGTLSACLLITTAMRPSPCDGVGKKIISQERTIPRVSQSAIASLVVTGSWIALHSPGRPMQQLNSVNQDREQ